jgi:GMP synthase-like glutamine amidotransferase
MKRAIVLQHVPFERPARIAELVQALGYEVDTRLLYDGSSVPGALDREELLIVMGGPMGVGDLSPEHPFLRKEAELLARCVAQDAPVLGVCLGAQLLAHAARAAVHPMRGARRYEVGWEPVSFHGVGTDVLAGIPSRAPMLHWHGDTFDLPHDARLLASTPACPQQAFQLGSRQFGLQFHCETNREDIAAFLREDAEFVVKANGQQGAAQLRQETDRYFEEFRSVGDRLLSNILRAMCSPRAE